MKTYTKILSLIILSVIFVGCLTVNVIMPPAASPELATTSESKAPTYTRPTTSTTVGTSSETYTRPTTSTTVDTSKTYTRPTISTTVVDSTKQVGGRVRR